MALRDIRKRIRSVKNTRQITKAMKMVSAAKLRRAQDAAIAARPYGQTLDAMMGQLVGAAGEVTHPLLTRHPGVELEKGNVELVVLTSDRGLAGGFNGNITRRVLKFVAENRDKKVVCTTLGRKANDFLRGKGVTVRRNVEGVWHRINYATAQELAAELSKRFLDGEVDEVHLMYNEFVSAVSQVPTTAQLLPVAATGNETAGADYTYEPSPEGVLEQLVPKAVAVKIYRAMLESFAAEHAARMSAMENATRNAGDMIGKLTLFYNRSRQALITKELMEIVSGAEALKG